MSGDELVTRNEYEQFTKIYEIRHSELRLEIKELETSLKGDVQNLSKKIDDLSSEVKNNGTDRWKTLSTSMLSFFIGVATYYVLYVTHIIH
jgi:uncharacterized transporter YbjL